MSIIKFEGGVFMKLNHFLENLKTHNGTTVIYTIILLIAMFTLPNIIKQFSDVNDTLIEYNTIAVNEDTLIPDHTTATSVNDSIEEPNEGTFDKMNENTNKDINIENTVLEPLPAGSSPASVYTKASLEDVIKNMEGELLLPSYVPAGFNLDSIQVNTSYKKNVILEYMSKGSGFALWISDKTIKNYNNSSKIIEINGNVGYISYLKSEPGDNTKKGSVELLWKYKDIYYWLSGSIDEIEAIKVAESIK